MHEFSTEKWHGLWWRIPASVFFLHCAYRLFISCLDDGAMGVFGFVLFAVACLTVVAMVMAPPLATWLAHSLFGALGGLVYPERTGTRPPPAYGPAEARRMAGRATEALRAYDAILEQYPDDGRVHLAMMDIAWQDMQNAALANDFYQRARAVVSNQECLAEMRLAYEDFAPYLPEEARECPTEVLGKGHGGDMRETGDRTGETTRRRIAEE